MALRAIRAFLETSDQHAAQRTIRNFLITYNQAIPEDQSSIQSIWNQANLGPFPKPK